MSKIVQAGIVTAYGAAVRGGYTGTYEEFCEEQARFAQYAQEVAEDRAVVEEIKVDITNETIYFSETTVPAAVDSVNAAGATQVQNIEATGSTAITNINATEQDAIAAVNTQKNAAVTAVNDEKALALTQISSEKTDAVNTITTNKNNALSAIATDRADALDAIDDAQDLAIDAIETSCEEQIARNEQVVVISDTQPTSPSNKIWIKETISEGTYIPTWEEFEHLMYDVADEYDTTGTYDVGDYVLYDCVLYRCKTTIPIMEAWTPAHWDRITIIDELESAKNSLGNEVSELNSALTDLSGEIFEETTPTNFVVEYTTTANAISTYYRYTFEKGKKYKIHLAFVNSGEPYPNSSGWACILRTTTAQSESSSYQVEVVKQSPDFSALDVDFAPTADATYLRLYTRSKSSGIYFKGSIAIEEVVSKIDSIESDIEYAPVNQFVSTDQVAVQTSYADVIDLYDALATAHPAIITKNALNDVSAGSVIYEYVFTTGNYNSIIGERTALTEYDKPKLLVTTGIHGSEKGSISATYTVMKAMCENKNLRRFLEQVEVHVVPVVNIYGMDNDDRLDENGVNINRNFDARWSISGESAGSYAASEYATSVIQAWLMQNNDALLYIDFHNSGYVDELTYFAVDLEETAANTNVICRSFWNGITRIYNYWENIRKLNRSSMIFGYVGKCPFTGTAIAYACEEAGIPSALLETPTRLNYEAVGDYYSNANIGVAAESFGNILLGFFDYLNANVEAVSE